MKRRVGKKAGARRGRPRKRPGGTSKPTDWLGYLQPIVREIPVALEILRRLRWASALKRRRLAEAPWPAGRYRIPSLLDAKERISSWRGMKFGFLHEPEDVLLRLLAPEEMAAKLTSAELRRNLDHWESEVRDWGQAIWLARAETLRLREQRSKLASEATSSFASGRSRVRLSLRPRAARSTPCLSCSRKWTKHGRRVVPIW
jgi:hypothetical protein